MCILVLTGRDGLDREEKGVSMATLSITFDDETIAVYAPNENEVGELVIECERVTDANWWGLEDDIDRVLGFIGLERVSPQNLTSEDFSGAEVNWISVEAR